MKILLVFIALALDTRSHVEATTPPLCGYNRTNGLDDADLDQYLSCSLMQESAGIECDGVPVCRAGFSDKSLCGQLCIDVDECNMMYACGVRLNCVNTIGNHLCIAFPNIDSREGDITLIDGNSFNEGLLAMFYNGEWILPCSTNWTDLDAAIICRQLDFQPGEFHPQSSRPVYANKMFKCSGSESSLDECYTEFSGVCHHVNLSCSNPRPLPPIEVCLPADEFTSTFSEALAEGVSEDCSCIYTANEIRFKSVTVSCPDGQNVLKYEIGNYHILPDGAVNDHIQNLSSMFGILNQCPDEVRADCSTTESPDTPVPLTAILVPIITTGFLLLVVGVIIIVRKRILRSRDETKIRSGNSTDPTDSIPTVPSVAYGVQTRECKFQVVTCPAYGIVPDQTAASSFGESSQEASYEVIA